MLRQDVFFAERKFSDNYCIKRQKKVPEMNIYSSKRKRMDEKSLCPEAASGIYERPGMGFLTTPIISGTPMEVEHPRKRFHPSADQSMLQTIGTTHPEDRVVFSGAKQELSREQIHQFMNSSVLLRQRTITKPGSATYSNVGYWSNGPSEIRPTQQNFQASQDGIVPRKTTQQYAKTNLYSGQFQPYVHTGPLYGQFQSRVRKVDVGGICSQKSSVQKGQIKQCATTAINQICDKNKKDAEKRRKKRKSKTIKAPQSSQAASNVDNNRHNQEASAGFATTHPVTTGDHFQNSPTNQHEPWSLVPQPVLMHVKPIEAQTNQTISKLLALRQAEKMSSGVECLGNNGYSPVVAKRKRDTEQSDCSSKRRKKMKGQNRGSKIEHLSTEQAVGMNTVKRIVVPPKISQNPTSYPPYVSRIMKILARGQQNQSEIPDDNECTEEITQKRKDVLKTESVSKARVNLNGLEMFGTSGDQCIVVPFL